MPRILLALIGILALTGCASAVSPTTSPTPPKASSSAALTGTPLSAFGFQHAPAAVTVPSEARIRSKVDAANNITVIFDEPSGLDLAAFFRTQLPAAGFQITADDNNSLIFVGGDYSGAFTTSGTTSALTLRTDR